ncbi:M56 family metallopeptidase [Bacteroides faecis]|uniref:M56 family metallopeptidase n=1 Tax=Bacteroides faecis TaxID=674529 RepID=UPI001D073567|nr:M56 family metallopeptidase [Bacteroides faecis]MCB6631633.1 M56 family metallopeptidase [Bacteroides faecis]MCE8941505.1 M56 family metallopeptidase [Bacteroides faecis]
MGAFLFYLLKSGCCLVIFYIFFKLMMSRSTFFRFNRITLLVGLSGCTLLPLIELTTTEETFLHTPLYAIHEILQSTEQVMSNPEEPGNEILLSEKNTEISSLNWIPVTLGTIYGAGTLLTFVWLSVSTCRLAQLIRMSEKKRYGNYILVIPRQPIASFSWGRYIVVSASDYSRQSEEVLLHEMMHLRNHHTLDLLFMQIFLLVHWFNPVIWLLKRELQEIHEFEADNGVINTGVDATKYQLLLVKKAVGTRLYSMANGFNHSKLKKRITMMLKERTNRWARLKLLLAVPVMAGALYVFAQPEVKEIPQQIQTEIQQDKADDYVSLMIFFRKEEEKYSKLVNGSNPPSWVKEKQAHQLLVNADNKVLFDGKFTSMDELKSAIIKNLLKSWEESSRQDAQVVFFQYDRGTEIAAITTILKEAKGAFEQIRADLSVTSTDKSKEHLDRLFPILLIEGAPKKYGLKELPVEERISGIVVTIHTSEGQEVVKDFTLTELKQKVTAARAKQTDPESLVVGLKIEKGCKIGFVTDVKQVLREASALKITYSSTDG